MQQEVTILEIDWTEAAGSPGSVGAPYLFGWLRAAYVRPGLISDGRVVVLAQKDQSSGWDRYQGLVTLTDADTLVSALALLGIPERAPRVESVTDASEAWRASSVRVVVADQVRTFTIETQSSGFRGEDAEGLRAVFRRILELCGCGDRQTMLDGTA